MKQGLREKCRRLTAGVLAFVMVSMLALGDAGVVFASEYGERFYQDESGMVDEDAYSDMVSTKAKLKNHREDGVTISVSATDDSDFRAGGEVYLDVHVKNEGNHTITEGILNFQGKKLMDSGAHFEEISEDAITEGIMRNEKEEEGFGSNGHELINDLEETDDSSIHTETMENDVQKDETKRGTETAEIESEIVEVKTELLAEESLGNGEQDNEIKAESAEAIETEELESEEENQIEETTNKTEETSEVETVSQETEAVEETFEDTWKEEYLEWSEDEDGERKSEIVAGDSHKRKKNKEDEENEEEDGLLQEITDIQLAPGQIYSVRFVYTVDETLERAKNQKVVFRFAGKDEKNKNISQHEMFYYTANYLNAGKVRFKDGNRVLTGEEVVMGIHTEVYDFDILLGDEEVEAEIASRSNAEEASSSNAQKATSSDWEEEEELEEEEEDEEEKDDFTVDLGDTSYKIEMTNARLNGFKARKALVEDANDNMLICTYRVSKNTKPGIYFGKIIQESKVKGKTYKSSQGFTLIVTGNGEVELKGGINGAEIQVKGPAQSFPDGDVLSLKVSEVPEEKKELVEAALEQKAQETGISVNKLRALDIKVISDGEEMELQGDVSVTFSNIKLQPMEKFVETAEMADEVAKEEGFSFFGLRRMSRAKAVGMEEEAGDIVLTSEPAEEEKLTENAEVANIEKNDNEEESTIAVWHLDEEAGVMNEMSSEVNDDGDVVMTTDHFSIYIVVDMGQLGGNVTLTVEHWGKDIETINANGTTDPYFIKVDNGTDKRGKRYGYHTVDDVYNRHKEEIVTTKYNGQLYTPDTIMIPNKTKYDSIEELSKVCLVTAKKEYADKNYQLSEVWISTNLNNGNKPTDQWANPKTKYTVQRDANGIITNKETITLAKNSIIRFVYTEKGVTSQYYQPVTFYDYNVTNGGLGVETKSVPKGKNQGTNTASNFTGGNKKMGVGQEGSGNTSDPWNNAHTNVSGLKGYLNRGNNAKGNSSGITYDKNVPDKTNGKDDSLISAVVRNEVEESLTSDYKLQFHPSIKQPGFFEEKKGTKKFTNYKLGFQQKGDTYILSTVQRGKTTVLKNLQKITYSAHNGKNDSNIYSNDFWPLDKEKYHATNYPNADPQVTETSDGGGTHNWHFGMHYAFTFRVGDYTGPMNFYFRGDDDFWLFVDGERVIDLGGIHFAVGQAIDMRKWLEQNGGVNGEHRIDIYFMERGGFGSCCYMQFTLPNCIPIDSPKEPQTQVTVKKEWSDYNNPNRPDDIDITLWQMHNGMKVDKGTVTLSKDNNWQYTWTELPVSDPNDNTLKYTYEVIEKNVPPGYDSQTIQTTGSDKNGWVITLQNKLDPEVKVKVTKEWADDNNNCDNRPDQLQFQLYADGKALVGKILTLSKENQVGNNNNMWSGEFNHLPKYRYEKDKDGNYVKNPDGTYQAVEIVYTVKELKGNTAIQEGGTFAGKHGEYTVSYTNALSESEKQNDYVAHVKVKNTHTCETVTRKAVKEWQGIPTDTDITATAKIGLYCKYGSDWEKVVKDANNQPLENPVEISWPTGTENQEIIWKNLPKYAGNNELQYGIFEVGADNKPVIHSGTEIILGTYKYKVTFIDPEAAQVTITNELMKAKLRVGKWIDNDDVPDDVMKDEFIITVIGNDSKFETGVVLNPAGHGAVVNSGTLTESKLSGYIEVPAKANGSEYTIGEKTDLKEYTPSTPFVTQYSGTGILNGTVITVKPGGDDVVLVHNRFDHKDYFHNDHSVTNKFDGEGKKPQNRMPSSQRASLDAVVPQQMVDGKVEPLDDDVRLA